MERTSQLACPAPGAVLRGSSSSWNVLRGPTPLNPAQRSTWPKLDSSKEDCLKHDQ
jgi:hypothetical protein